MKSVRLMHALCRRVEHTSLARLSVVELRRQYAEKCDSVIKGVVVGVYAKEGDRQPRMTPSGEKFDDRVQGKITDLIRETGLNGQLGKGRVFMNVDAEFRAVAVVGVGRDGAGFNDLEMIDEGMENARVAAGDCLSMYRGCMSGAAACVGVIRAAAALSLPLNITALLPLCENMPSGMAAKPGDVVSLLNGKTLGFVDVSKAGVMAMADPLLYGQTTYKPRMVVDVATVGYAVCPALGGAAAGIFSNSNFVYKQFEKAGGLTGDRVWRLPLWRYFKELIMPNETFDISNRGRGPASSCIAAAVLHELVPCVDWAHLDIRNVGMLTRHNPLPYLLKDRMTGRPTRTIVQFLYQIACPDSK
ncbi:GL17468 [Drosophila persimilis]|uniref:Cytosol aminopeptidase n=1 Tax=Drosophila persimilis TaxID=7234 RepID=B4GH60_DROPE|nr:GL17468 [Drosophila persimilis]